MRTIDYQGKRPAQVEDSLRTATACLLGGLSCAIAIAGWITVACVLSACGKKAPAPTEAACRYELKPLVIRNMTGDSVGVAYVKVCR